MYVSEVIEVRPTVISLTTCIASSQRPFSIPHSRQPTNQQTIQPTSNDGVVVVVHCSRLSLLLLVLLLLLFDVIGR